MTLSAPNHPPAADGASSSGAARWLNLVTTAVLVAVAGTVLGAAAPSLLRAGIGATAEVGDFPPPVRVTHPTLVPQHHPRPRGFEFAPESDDSDSDDGNVGPSFPMPRGEGPGLKPRRAPAGDDDDGPGGGLGIKSGITMRPLLLRDRRTNSIVREVRAGESVSVLSEDGDWVLVAHESDARIVTGWARRNELLLR